MLRNHRPAERNAYRPRIAEDYQPAPLRVWLLTVLLLGIAAGVTAVRFLMA